MAGAGRRVALLPVPLQGHVGPMFNLAGVLRSHSFAITVFHFDGDTAYVAGTGIDDYSFISIPSGGAGGPAESDNIKRLVAMNAACDAALEGLLAAAGDVACLVVDAHLLSAQQAAQRAGVPVVVLRTGSAASAGLILRYPQLCDMISLPVCAERMDEPLPELPPYRVKDLLSSRAADSPDISRYVGRMAESLRTASAVVLNTFDALEHAELERLRQDLTGAVPVFAVGPLHKLSTADVSLFTKDQSCIPWLDAQPAMSVLYVSFGSIAALSPEEFEEVGWGLCRSGCRFLWVVRPGLAGRDAQRAVLPEGFAEAVGGRGIVVEWAPQQEVLEHPAIGGFLTHGGWNSVIESVAAGVPMLCRPCFGDQAGNGRYVEAVWGLGVELDGELERSNVEAAVRKVMSGEESDAARVRVKAMKAMAELCAGEGGTSQAAVDGLVAHILALRRGGEREGGADA